MNMLYYRVIVVISIVTISLTHNTYTHTQRELMQI